MTTKTPAQVKADLQRKGLSIAKWADAHGLSQPVVYQVLSGRHKGLYGEAHKAAVLLGLKSGEIVAGADGKTAARGR